MKSLVPQAARDDFRNFLYLVWQHLGLPSPTPAQYAFAQFLQHGDEAFDADSGRADIIEGFRGVGKSFISAAFVLWRLDANPRDEKILVVSASSTKSKEFVNQCKGIMNTMDMLMHLRPEQHQLDQSDRFDVRGASLAQSPSLKAAGITGQITGSRATLIVADDIEVPDNSYTEDARMKVLNKVNEFDAIIMPGCDILFLGTPQTEESIYNKLIKERGFFCYCWPGRYPTEEKRASYILEREDGSRIDILARQLREAYDADPKALAWKPTDPDRFDDEELTKRESRGRSYFMLQFMLDTTLSDAERYPLKQHDLIVMPLNTAKAPMTISWGRDSDSKNVRNELKNYGFSGDFFMGPLFVDSDWASYDSSVLFVDPAGRGADECAWAIVKALNGVLYVTRVHGMNAPVDETMVQIALDAKLHNVSTIQVEPNYAGEMWINTFYPVLSKLWPGTERAVTTRKGEEILVGDSGGCRVEEADWAKGMKEMRIIETLEPVMNMHRLVVDETVAADPILMHQLTHIAKERNCLQHDDRIDALSGAVAFHTKSMMQNMDQAKKAKQEEEFQAELDQLVEDIQYGHLRSYIKGRRKGTEVYQS